MTPVFPTRRTSDLPGARDIADRLMANRGSARLYWDHYSHNGRIIDVQTDDDSIGGHFLHLLHGQKPSDDWVRAMHTSLILYAEHEFNASTFTGRVIAGTGSDMYSAITKSEEHTSVLQSLMRISYAVFCLKKKKT